eukprot:TRINITY_DN1285_c0_g1_i4.p1 TRINITY_DN1285_c0_g1~~TRINITY_DN1285_c0_g1_i4.p1  ORF type:complete len:482 (-),score=91.20 TRINITY_DN1285_c0_g1_i4:89-1534(-)
MSKIQRLRLLGIRGTLYFIFEDSSTVRVVAEVEGVTVNARTEHGMHIHQYGDLTTPLGTPPSAGDHYRGQNGTGNHLCPTRIERDTGDMGNWFVDPDGRINKTKTLDLISLGDAYSIIGRAVVLHEKTDDCVIVSSSGSRLAHCTIGIGNPAMFPPHLGPLEAPNTAWNPNPNPHPTPSLQSTFAVCDIRGTPRSPNITGTVTFEFEPEDGHVRVSAVVSGLESGTVHGFHVHEFGDLSMPDGSSVGAIFDADHAHAQPGTGRHVGDMGNLCAISANDTYYYDQNEVIKLNFVNNIIGRSVVIDLTEDTGSDNETEIFIATCVIGIANPVTHVSLPDDTPDPWCASPTITSSYSSSTTFGDTSLSSSSSSSSPSPSSTATTSDTSSTSFFPSSTSTTSSSDSAHDALGMVSSITTGGVVITPSSSDDSGLSSAWVAVIVVLGGAALLLAGTAAVVVMRRRMAPRPIDRTRFAPLLDETENL